MSICVIVFFSSFHQFMECAYNRTKMPTVPYMQCTIPDMKRAVQQNIGIFNKMNMYNVDFNTCGMPNGTGLLLIFMKIVRCLI